MVDFWMTIGRALSNETVLETLLEALPPKDYPIHVPLRGFVFAKEDYDRARSAVVGGLKAANLPAYPVSLMALGELLYTSSSANEHTNLREAVKMMKAHGIGDGQEPLFYTALGALMVDPAVRRMFEDGMFEEAMFGGLKEADKTTLGKVAADPEFHLVSNAFEDLWVLDCFVRSAFYSGHVHPATPPAVDRFLVKNKLASAAGAGGGGAPPIY